MDQSLPVMYTEDELVLFLKKKDLAVFNYLYKSYSLGLYTVINKIVGDDHTSEDVLQDVFVKIWCRIDQYDPQKGRIFTWMLNIARNAAKDVLRSKGEIMKHKIHPGEIVLHVIAQSHQQTDTIGIKALVSKLQPDCQVVLEMAYYGGYTTIDIAKALYLPEGTVKTRIRKALKILRSKFHYTASFA